MRRTAPVLLGLVLLVACGGDAESPSSNPAPSSGGDELIVQAASYDLVAGTEGRIIVGVLTSDQLFVSYGEVSERFTYLGTKSAPVEDGPTIDATAEFLAIEGEPGREGPVAGTVSEGRGVYASDVTFDEPGFWSVEVTAELPEGSATGEASFEVREEPMYPAVGEPAPRSDNLLLGAKDAPAEAIDSRADERGKVPDPELHRVTVAESVSAGEPALVVVSTPVYCVSRFCGPITDMVAELAERYSDRANFIHIEVWRDFEGRAINRGAADWVFREQDITEPWIFFVGADGKIAARWDNVAVPAEIEPWLEELPKL